ncbi:hypothetical protein CWI42_121480 [Ordospora colligata]|uniref:Uncharacterized protein n=1 Tax=Ordospora colligata OC4 TaxID=1354746 RepID=A0A0B2UIW5_9MICR|nr:uncharacterized protein M896_121480 [Ordospora colligata OC4]KHN68925.1 hypothetical protein M896_121480 [Ordospora colligata OC4]TBU13959.1 hypothetical protein CWI40_121480 [Ordospora colligata]TBU14148.1 hypothetical protein CWI41_121480 [Ordospora colligata]TBU17817.1 hypothetical protein CWI42_121480 [Ordospora colligata]
MSLWTIRLYQYFAFKSFTPFLSFMVPYLVEKKGFSINEMHNSFSPLFFISSTVVSLVSFLIIELLGNKMSLFADTMLEIIVYLILMFMPFRSTLLISTAYVLHGATTSFGVVMKSILNSTADKNEDKNVILSTATSIKTFVGVVSSWLGQDIIMCGGTHLVNMCVSLSGLLLALITTLILPGAGHTVENAKFVDSIKTPAEMWKKMKNAYSKDVIVASTLSSSAGILYICLSFYSAGIFLEKKSGIESNMRINRMMFLIAKPVRLLSYTIIKLFSLMDSSVVYHMNPSKAVIIHGYIDGCSKILSSLIGLQVTRVVSKGMCIPFGFVASAVAMAFAFLLWMSSSMSYSYMFYILSFIASSICKTIANMGLQNVCDATQYKFILSFNLFLSSFIHISITFYSKQQLLSLRSKLMVYFYVNIFFITIALVLWMH